MSASDGPVTAAVRACVDALESDAAGRARAALAVRLAQILDSGNAQMAAAAIGRELRETLIELTAGEDSADDEFKAFVAGLRAVPA